MCVAPPRADTLAPGRFQDAPAGEDSVHVPLWPLVIAALASIGLAGAYGIYTFFAVVSIGFVLKMVHETRGVELEDMEG